MRSSPGASSATNSPIAAASTTTGMSPVSQAGRRRAVRAVAVSLAASITSPRFRGHGGRGDRVDQGRRTEGVLGTPRSEDAGMRRYPASSRDLEEAHPAQFSELAHVGVEHVLAGVGEAQLEDSALALTLDDGVREVARLEARAGRVVVEEVGVDVERVDRIELEQVHEVDPHELVTFDLYRLVDVGEGDGGGRVDLVGAVEVRVEAGHEHDQLVRRRGAPP